jgi:hypothetical protein
MYKTFYHGIIIMLLIYFWGISVHAQDENFGYEKWPGKSGAVKHKIDFPKQLITQFNLELSAGSKKFSFFYMIQLKNEDNIKNGRLEIDVYPSVEKAQLGLVEYMNSLQTPFKPPRISDKDFKSGDVAFGSEKDEILWLAFTKNNVRIIIHAPFKTGNVIADELGKTIQNAPIWTSNDPEPAFILP